ncbi:methyltransferase [Actinokineospora sp. NBRC 105648]|nr:methyltransferase [Actinokineospora sp. NBRC 105648]
MRLAERGHHVTVVDYSSAMISAGIERAARAGVSERVAFVEADVSEMPREIVEGQFDVVLCHNLVQYVDDTVATLAAVLAPLRAGGIFSVMAINQHSAPLALAVRELDLGAALAALGTDQARTATFGTGITLHTAEGIGAALSGLGGTVLAHYGIRSFCDYITDDDRKHDPDFFAELEKLELAVTNRFPYPHTARMFQLVGRV